MTNQTNEKKELLKDFNNFIIQEQKFLSNFTRKLSPNNWEDVLQEAQINVYKAINKGNSNVYSITKQLFFTAIRNVVINQYRNSNKNKVLLCEPNFVEASLDKETYDKDAFLLKELKEALEAVLGAESANLFNHYVEGYSEKEMSKIFNIPKGTVKSRLSKAKADLKKHIKIFENFKD